MTFEREFYTILDYLQRNISSKPIVLGGYGGAGGGSGLPPGGFIGQLSQNRVTYDTLELATDATASSGQSLVDNLNHIRYDIELLASGQNLRFEEDDVEIASGIQILNFVNNFTLSDQGNNRIEIAFVNSPSGENTIHEVVFNEDLSSQVDGVETSFTILGTAVDEKLSIYYNGLKQDPTRYSITGGGTGFTTTFTPASGDTLVVDYAVISGVQAYLAQDHGGLSGLADDDHPQYHNNTRGDARYYTQDQLDNNVLNTLYYTKTELNNYFVSSGTFTEAGQLIVGSGYADYELLNVGTDGQYLIADSTAPLNIKWGDGPSSEIYHQAVFTVSGANLSDTGVQPLRIYLYLPAGGGTLKEIMARVATAPASSSLRVDAKVNGTSRIAAGYVQIAVGNYQTSVTSFTSTTLTNDDYIQLDIVQGDTTAADLTLHFRYTV